LAPKLNNGKVIVPKLDNSKITNHQFKLKGKYNTMIPKLDIRKVKLEAKYKSARRPIATHDYDSDSISSTFSTSSNHSLVDDMFNDKSDISIDQSNRETISELKKICIVCNDKYININKSLCKTCNRYVDIVNDLSSLPFKKLNN
jgi:hypothetical protein